MIGRPEGLCKSLIKSKIYFNSKSANARRGPSVRWTAEKCTQIENAKRQSGREAKQNARHLRGSGAQAGGTAVPPRKRGVTTGDPNNGKSRKGGCRKMSRKSVIKSKQHRKNTPAPKGDAGGKSCCNELATRAGSQPGQAKYGSRVHNGTWLPTETPNMPM